MFFLQPLLVVLLLLLPLALSKDCTAQDQHEPSSPTHSTNLQRTLAEAVEMHEEIKKLELEKQQREKAQHEAAEFLGNCTEEADKLPSSSRSDCVQKLSEILRGRGPGGEVDLVRLQAIRRLQRFAPENKQAIHELVNALHDETGIVRAEAASLLAKLEPNNHQLVEQYLNDPRPEIRWTAVKALATDKSAEATATLSRLLGDENLTVQSSTVSVLQERGGADSEALLTEYRHRSEAELIRSLASKDRERRNSAVTLVTQLKLKAAIPELLKLLETKYVFLSTAFAALAPESVPPLLEKLRSGSEAEREAAASALGLVKPTQAAIIKVLEEAGGMNASIGLRVNVMAALKMIGTPEALAALERLQKLEL